jgi:CRISPR-associated endonuclease/helicase Cas3
MTDQLSFDEWFTRLTGHCTAHPWQRELAADPTSRDRVVRIPTGLGKTQGVLAAWSFQRLHHNNDRWPRRLIWCLPMRVLVEQTEGVAR